MSAARMAPTKEAALREPWKELARQRQAVEIGMWAFLASELLFFSGLFAGYAVYRSLYPQAFWEAGAETDLWFGGANTVILLISSAVMALVPPVRG